MITIPKELLIAASFTAIGGVTFVAHLRTYLRAIDSEGWPTVDGEIIETGVVTDAGNGGGLFAPLVRYRFRIGDSQYLGDCINFGGPFKSSFRWPAEDLVERYRKGRAVRVHVCPQDPNLSVLEPGVRWYVYLILLLTAACLAYGVHELLAYFGLLPDWLQWR